MKAHGHFRATFRTRPKIRNTSYCVLTDSRYVLQWVDEVELDPSKPEGDPERFYPVRKDAIGAVALLVVVAIAGSLFHLFAYHYSFAKHINPYFYDVRSYKHHKASPLWIAIWAFCFTGFGFMTITIALWRQSIKSKRIEFPDVPHWQNPLPLWA